MSTGRQLGLDIASLIKVLGADKAKTEDQAQNEQFLSDIMQLLGDEDKGAGGAGFQEGIAASLQEEELRLGKTERTMPATAPEELIDLGLEPEEEVADATQQLLQAQGDYWKGEETSAAKDIMDVAQTDEQAATALAIQEVTGGLEHEGMTESEYDQVMEQSIEEDFGMDVASTQPKYHKAKTYVEMLKLANKYDVDDTKVLNNIMDLMYPTTGAGATDYKNKLDYQKALKGPGGLEWNLEKMKAGERRETAGEKHKGRMSAQERRYGLMGQSQEKRAEMAYDLETLRQNYKQFAKMDASVQEVMAQHFAGNMSKDEAAEAIGSVVKYYENQVDSLSTHFASEEFKYQTDPNIQRAEAGQLTDVIESLDKARDAVRTLKIKGTSLKAQQEKWEGIVAKASKAVDAAKTTAERKEALRRLKAAQNHLKSLK